MKEQQSRREKDKKKPKYPKKRKGLQPVKKEKYKGKHLDND